MSAFQVVNGSPQVDLLINHFKSVPTISGHEARGLYRIDSLPRRILDMEGMGFKFFKEPRTDVTGKRYKRYHCLNPDHTPVRKAKTRRKAHFDHTEFRA